MTRKELKRKLRMARDLMNHDGAHWIRRQWSRKFKDGSYGYCAIGAIGAVAESKEEQAEMQEALCKALDLKPNIISGGGRGKYAATKYRGPIERWNDDARTDWKMIKAGFTKAAR